MLIIHTEVGMQIKAEEEIDIKGGIAIDLVIDLAADIDIMVESGVDAAVNKHTVSNIGAIVLIQWYSCSDTDVASVTGTVMEIY